MAGCNSIGPNSILGLNSSFIKYSGGDVIAQEGPTTLERLQLSDIRIPYKQILKTRLTLKPGIQNYLLNYTSMGDNATYLSLVARYDSLSRIESNNYLEYYYYNNTNIIHNFSQILTLSGNSTHRIPQIYLNNPNTQYSVSLDVMIAVIDDNTSFFFNNTDNIIPSNAIVYSNMKYTDIRVYDPYNPGPIQNIRTLSIHDNTGDIVAFLEISTINSILLSNNLLIVDDSALGAIYFSFVDNFNASQANSWLNYVIENPTNVTGTFSGTGSSIEIIPHIDNTPPLITYNNNIILPFGPTGVTYTSTWSSTTQSFISNTILSLTSFGGTVSKDNINTHIVYDIIDNRDGIILFDPSFMIILDNTITLSSVTQSGTYSIIYNINDNAGLNTNFIVILPIQ